MKIYLSKFGTTLISREAGREALAAFRPSLKDLSEDDDLEVDFEGVITFSPSWGDEFLSPLHSEFGDRLILANVENPSVEATLKLLEKIHQLSFIIKN